MSRYDRFDLQRDDDLFRWDDLCAALIVVGPLIAAGMGWI